MAFEGNLRRLDGVSVVDLTGDIDREAESAIEAAFDEALAVEASVVLLNFDDVGYVNSSGIAIIVGLLGKAKAAGREVRVCGLTDHYREIFEITRLADFMRIFPDEASAVSRAAL